MIFGVAAGALAAVAGAALLAAARRRAPALPSPLADPPPTDVLLPVRDEEDNVAACLASILAQSAPLRVQVLDDGSRDRTAERARAAARGDRRAEVQAVPPPPAGANGKAHALAWGAARAEHPWILAVDADARLAPSVLARALAAAELHRLDALSLAARQAAASPGEALLTPAVFALLDALLGGWRAAAVGRGPAVANGQFFLVRRAALAAAGGYDAILGRALDDVALARRLAGAGFRVGFWRARGLVRVRMYRGLGATFRGWRRNLALLVGDRPGLAAGAAAAALAPALLGVAALVGGGGARGLLIGWAGGAAASLLLRAGGGSSPAWGLLYPLDAAALALCLAAAVSDRARGRVAPWRGRPVAPGGATRD